MTKTLSGSLSSALFMLLLMPLNGTAAPGPGSCESLFISRVGSPLALISHRVIDANDVALLSFGLLHDYEVASKVGAKLLLAAAELHPELDPKNDADRRVLSDLTNRQIRDNYKLPSDGLVYRGMALGAEDILYMSKHGLGTAKSTYGEIWATSDPLYAFFNYSLRWDFISRRNNLAVLVEIDPRKTKRPPQRHITEDGMSLALFTSDVPASAIRRVLVYDPTGNQAISPFIELRFSSVP